MEKRFSCDYLDLSKQGASDMLLNCVQDKSKGYDLNCRSDYVDTKQNQNNLAIKRGIEQGFNGIEGFTSKIFYTDNGPGESYVEDGVCPDGFSYCSKSKKCVQVCMGCKYRDNMKSMDMNEYDPCFPNGVYDGITNSGDVKCTCGNNNKYCSDNMIKKFTSDGTLIDNNKIHILI